ncbi:glycosyltransferase family 1 protein [Kribbella turkmenica]|uniref:Glycosyltransferase family 1 protein n=1 Tax=Kribbella turkmenica TaxID=2530375 RepID=A0A4R4WXZ5_9ACTN|nr:glycosyltransferase family 4 protein [Kribbella turkmenica]TDD22631.1 glycosyltransferase family 1 protein [Kribbella turkmenica]
MRIALVSDCFLPRVGGIELQVHDLARQLVRAGHSVTVLTTTAGPPATTTFPVVRLPALAGIPLPAAADVLRNGMSRFDVVHAHTSLISPLSWQAARIAQAGGVGTVVTLHSLPGPTVLWPPAWLDRRLGDVGWTAVSDVVADVLRRSLPGRTVDVLHNGIDAAAWRRPRRSGHPLTIVSTMRLTRRKRPVALVRTLELIRDQLPPGRAVRAILAGAGPQAQTVAAEVRRRGMSEWVRLPGRLTRHELQQLYAGADVYLAPAELESFGVAALEARCAGLPVVAMASGGVGEFVRHGIEGFLVDSDTAMAATTAALLTDRELLARMQVHNRSTDPVMTWDDVVVRHLAAYRTQRALSGLSLASAP